MRVAIALDQSNGSPHVQLPIDHVSPINNDRWYLRNAKTPRISDALVATRQPSDQILTRVSESLLHECRCFFRVRRQPPRELGFDPIRRVKLDQSGAGRHCDWVLSIGNHPDICRGGIVRDGNRATDRYP
jgi:hypothetical protein